MNDMYSHVTRRNKTQRKLNKLKEKGIQDSFNQMSSYYLEAKWELRVANKKLRNGISNF